MAIVTLLTDFGTRDYYVGALKGVLLSLAPAVQIVDISHDIAPGDVEEASFLLRAAAPEYPAGTIHLAVVDPGVGSDRRLLALRGPEADYVAPDNGLLTPQLDTSDVRAVERTDLFRVSQGETFHGRDRFAPVAAYLARGDRFEELGPRHGTPVRWATPLPRLRGSLIEGHVAHIDRFGNLVTDIPTKWLRSGSLTARVLEHSVQRQASHYDQLNPGEVGLIPGSLGTLELSLNGDSLAERWAVKRGASVRIETKS